MEQHPRTVILHGVDAEASAQVRDALGDEFGDDFRVAPAGTVATVRERARTATYGSVILIDGRDAEAAVASTTFALPDVPVIALVDPGQDSVDLSTLVRKGIAEVVVLPDDVRGGRLARVIDRALPDEIIDIAEEVMTLSGKGRVLLETASRIGQRAGLPRDLADEVHASPATLLRMFEREGLPVPRRVMLFVRGLAASRMLDAPHRSVAEAARAAGYTTDQAFTRTIRNLTGLPPGKLRDRGATGFMRETVRRHMENESSPVLN